jgi:hypothetical protein
MGKVKGSSWIAACEFINRKYGSQAVAKVVEKMDSKDIEILSQPILPITWLDYGTFIRFQVKADKILGLGDYRLMVEGGSEFGRASFNGIYKVFIRILTPSFVLGKAAQLWRQTMDPGELTVFKETAKGVELKLTGFPDMPLHHEMHQGSFIAEIARLTGIKNVKDTHPKCLARGDDHCIFQLKWE